jgi:hypothetical protein
VERKQRQQEQDVELAIPVRASGQKDREGTGYSTGTEGTEGTESTESTEDSASGRGTRILRSKIANMRRGKYVRKMVSSKAAARGSEADRQKGQRGREAKGQRGREAKRQKCQRGKEAKGQRGREAKGQRGREAKGRR